MIRGFRGYLQLNILGFRASVALVDDYDISFKLHDCVILLDKRSTFDIIVKNQ